MLKDCPNGLFLLGDAAYPLSGNLITPVKDTGSLTSSETYFNFCHSSTRMAIERAFGLLKGRFRRLKYLNIVQADKRARVVVIACMLHNVCLLGQSGMEQGGCDVNDLISAGVDVIVDTTSVSDHTTDVSKQKRQHIIVSLSRQ